MKWDELYIGGAWVAGAGGGRLEVHSPATLDLVGEVPLATSDDLDRAVGAARAAFDDGPWPQMPMRERAERLAPLVGALQATAAELDELVPRESGIPIVFASGSSSIPLVEYYLELARADTGEEVRPGRPGATGDGIVRHVPVGVVAGITPWNGPVMQVLMKLVPALLAGCPVVVKPAPETPLSAMKVAEALAAADLPPGVVSVVPGGRELGEHLVRHPGVDHVSFTGSTRAGLEIAATCGAALRRVNLELGGKSAAILLDDVDLDATLPTVAQFGYFFNGEACAALTRVLAPVSQVDDVVAGLADIVSAYPVGDSLDPATFIGPLVTEAQRERVERYVAIGRDEGARVVCGGGRPDGMPGWYVEPTLFADVDNAMRIARDEIFGPVVCVIGYDGVDDAVAIANDSELGLAGAVFAADEARAVDVARRIRTGHVGINTLGMDWVLPFGGFKKSGVGRELGREGLRTFQELQCIGLPLAGGQNPR
ncbi:MAG TPA: aldehyde dehydrogenase [Acidimicrobiia bacterium]|nr:aldehyde dehydrogenase [Acidimicrobiia bacterium]